jgi:transcriptional regulator of heat shock response
MEYSKTVGLVEYVSEEVGRILKDNKNSRLIKGDE